MDELVKTCQYGAMNTKDTIAMGKYVIKFLLEAYTLQEDTTCTIKIITSGKLFVKAQYMNCMHDNTNYYW